VCLREIQPATDIHHIVRLRKAGLARRVSCTLRSQHRKVFVSKSAVGGRGGALPRALAALGHQVSVYLPRYRQTRLADPATVVRSITIPSMTSTALLGVAEEASPECAFILSIVRNTSIATLFMARLPGLSDNAERFALFSRAVLEATKILACRRFSIVTTGSRRWCGAAAHRLCRRPAFRDAAPYSPSTTWATRPVPPETLPLLMLPWDLFTMSKMEFFDR